MLLGVPALLCMDLQVEFITPGRPWADPDGEAIAERCSRLLDEARKADWQIIHAQLYQGGPMIAGHGQTRSIPGCEPRAGEVLLRRPGVSAYTHPDIRGVLQGSMVEKVYMIGFSAPLSITATLFDARDYGDPVYLVEEMVGSADVCEWSADETRALCLDTARKIGRTAPLSELGLTLPEPAPLRIGA